MTDTFKREIEESIEIDDPEELLSVVIDLALVSTDPIWATECLLALTEHAQAGVRGNALMGLVHLAQRFPEMDLASIRPVIEIAQNDRDRHVRDQAGAALEELKTG